MSFVKKPLGLILLFFGLTVIFYGLYSSFNIFTAKAAPPEVFKVEEQASSPKGGVEEIIGEQLKGMIPAGSLPTLLNLMSWSIFAGILIFGGAQISSLGIKLIK